MPLLFTYLKLCAAVFAWGGTFIAAKFAVAEASIEVSSLTRFTLAALLLLVILRLRLGHLPRLNRLQLFYVVMLGLTGVTLYNLFFFFGLQTVEAGRGALIITSNPLWVALGAALFFQQRFMTINLLGLLFCASGVTIVLSRGNVAELLSVGIGAGEAALLGCALSWAAYTLFGKKLMLSHSPLQPLVLVAYSCVSGSVLLILWMGVSGQALNLSSSIEFWISILYLSVLGTVVAFVWYFEGVHRIGAAQSSVFVFLVPVSALLLGSLILDEPLTLSLLVGGGLIITGVVMVNYTSKRTVSGSVA